MLPLIFAILTQVVYIILLALVFRFELKDWRDNGFTEYMRVGSNIVTSITTTKQLIVDKIISRSNPAYAETRSSRSYNFNHEQTVEDMRARDMERLQNAQNLA